MTIQPMCWPEQSSSRKSLLDGKVRIMGFGTVIKYRRESPP
jgi:hypothetical protein